MKTSAPDERLVQGAGEAVLVGVLGDPGAVLVVVVLAAVDRAVAAARRRCARHPGP